MVGEAQCMLDEVTISRLDKCCEEEIVNEGAESFLANVLQI